MWSTSLGLPVRGECGRADSRRWRPPRPTGGGSGRTRARPTLAAALAAEPALGERFASLTSAGRYSVLHPLMTAATPETRARRLAKALDGLRGARP